MRAARGSSLARELGRASATDSRNTHLFSSREVSASALHGGVGCDVWHEMNALLPTSAAFAKKNEVWRGVRDSFRDEWYCQNEGGTCRGWLDEKAAGIIKPQSLKLSRDLGSVTLYDSVTLPKGGNQRDPYETTVTAHYSE